MVVEKRVWIKKIQEYWKKHKLALKFIELIAVFLVTEFLNIKLGTYVQFQYVDLRLLFIVIMGSVHGMSMGIIAAGLACMSTLFGYVRLGVD